ncbi:MAG: gluconate 2-dehydrogenase subunit 3 family protein [Gammaproteobacteria bacterium]
MSDQGNNNSKSPPDDRPANPSRRNLLKNAGLVGAGTIASTAMPGVSAQEDNTAAPALEALEVLTSVEAEILEAICDRIIPADENGPGAKEARAVHYIDRSLASHNRGDRDTYMVGLNAINDYARQTRRKAFAELNGDSKDSILLALQRNRIPDFPLSGGAFFNLLRNHTIDGTFCDPYYGGNQGFVGWDLIRYPGVRQSASDADVRLGPALEPNHQSAYDYGNFAKSAGREGESG